MKTKVQSFIQTHKKGFRLLKVVHQIDRNMIPCLILEAVLNAFLPYSSIFLSAVMLDELLAGRFKEALLAAAVMISLAFVFGLLGAVLHHHNQVSGVTLQDKILVQIRKKGMELDYSTMEDPEVLGIIRNTESAAYYNGGLDRLVEQYAYLLQYGLSSLTAIVLTVELLFTKAEGEGGMLRMLANPFVTAVILLAAWLLGMLCSGRSSADIRRIEDEIAEEHYKVENNLGYWLNDILMNLSVGKILRVNGMGGMVLANSEKIVKAGNELFGKMGAAERKKTVVGGVESGLFSVVAYFIVLVKVLANAISIGSFTKYSGALLQFNQAGSQLIWSENEINRLTKNLIFFADFLERENKMATGSIHVEKRLDNRYEIEFKDVGFRYPGNDTFALRHVNAKITLKNKLAVVGKNGAGKTTFIKLLCRLYDPTEGVITLNGVDIRKYDYEEYLRLFGVVFQNFHLFGYPVAQNVAASAEYDAARVAECLKKAGAYEFVQSLPNGMDTVIETGEDNGVDLSGGQSQKISIARALYKDAPFVILDEPTAALDPISESEIYERFHEMVQDKTSVYISHRMSSCRFCDEILVFDQGTICERGSHEELTGRNGLYAALWEAQAQYYA